MERDDINTPLLPATSPGRQPFHYQVCGLVNGVAARMDQAILESSVSCAVTSVTRKCSQTSKVYGSIFRADVRHCIMCFMSIWLHTSQTEHGVIPPLFSALSALFLFHLPLALSLKFQLRHAQRRFSRSASPQDPRCFNFSASRQWDDNQPLGRCRLPAAYLWTGGNFGGDHGKG